MNSSHENDLWLQRFRADIVDHMQQHVEGCVATIRRLPPGSDEACLAAADLAHTEQSLETVQRRFGEA